jgi:hypothetical protein
LASAGTWGGAASAQPFPDGSFIVHQTMVYRIVGGAPLYVSNWGAVGGEQPVTEVNAVQMAALRPFPADQTYLYASGGGVFIVAGGAPIFLSDWAAVGGSQPGLAMDEWAINNTDNPAAHLRRYPANGTFLRTIAGRVYRVAGGATFPVANWASFGGVQYAVLVDQYAIDRPDTSLAHLRSVPLDGTQLVGVPSNVGWTVDGGRKRQAAVNGSAVLLEDAAIAGLPDVLTATSGGRVVPGMVNSVVVSGSGFGDGSAVTTTSPDVSVLATHVTDSRHLTVTIAVPAGVAAGTWDLKVTARDGAGAVCRSCLAITAPPPVVGPPDTPPTPLGPAVRVPLVPRFLPSFVTTTRRGRTLLVGIAGMNEVPRGSSIELRCIRGCRGSAAFDVRKKVRATRQFKLKRKTILGTKSVVEVRVRRSGHRGRYAQFKFTRVTGVLIGHRFRSGCVTAEAPYRTTVCR